MKPPIIIVAALALAGAILLYGGDRRPPQTVESERNEALAANTDEANPDSNGVESTPPNINKTSQTPQLGQVFRCTVESVDPVAELSAEDSLTMEDETQRNEARHEQFMQRLALSGDLNHQLTLGLLQSGESSPLTIETFAPLLSTMPENEVLHWRLLEACDVRPTHPICSDDRAEARVIAALGSNGELWAKIAYFRAKRGDQHGALEALRNAASADEMRDLWGAEVGLIFDSLAIEPDYTTSQRLIVAIGISAALLIPHTKLILECRKYGESSAVWRDACIAYGARRERDAETFIGRGIGQGLQMAMHELAGDEAAVAATKAREIPVMEMMRGPAMRDGEILLMADESVAIAWLQRLRVYGEISAREFLKSEVERVSKIPGYDPCPPVEP